MKKIKKTIAFSISSLIAAGVPAIAASDSQQDESNFSFFDDAKNIIAKIKDQQVYTLAAHSSHASHGSHGSHRSAINNTTDVDPQTLTMNSRNESSTPRSTVLPSSPAISKPRALKRLPGNSGKFKDAILRLQVSLASQGFNVGAINGELHSRTIAAIYEFQSKSGLIPSGKATPETLDKLGITIS
ncbi:MAG: hypothetical protein HOK72_05485 [Flavobacteriales bacterium]|jgi:His-Xaa-Ser repeat protein HxsA|nr:hypothetical protein [Flavobacteriales bacterium]